MLTKSRPSAINFSLPSLYFNRNLEVHESSAWPSNGLALANTVISVLNNIGSDSLGGIACILKVAVETVDEIYEERCLYLS